MVGDGSREVFAVVGIPREPWDFVKEAVIMEHPTLRAMKVGAPLLGAIRDQMDDKGLGFRRKQCAISAELVNACKELEATERNCTVAWTSNWRRY